MEPSEPSFVIVGAGAIGAFVGLLLDAAGFRVRFLQRDSQTARKQRALLATNGLVGVCSTDPYFRVEITAERVASCFTTDPACLKTCTFVLVATKRTSNPEVVKQLAAQGVQCPVVFLQNGLRIGTDFGEVSFEVMQSVVTFNVVYDIASGVVTLGQLMSTAKLVLDGQSHSAGYLAALLSKLPIRVLAIAPLLPIQAGKLLQNMTNAVNALSGVAILPMFSQLPYRLVVAASMDEAMKVFAAAGVVPLGTTFLECVQLRFLLQLMRAPQWFFMAVLGKKLKGRGAGRTSMAQDLDARRVPTEVHFLNGEIVRMGEVFRIPTPVNKALVAAVEHAEKKNLGCPAWTGKDLMTAVGVEDTGTLGRMVFNGLVVVFLLLCGKGIVSLSRWSTLSRLLT